LVASGAAASPPAPSRVPAAPDCVKGKTTNREVLPGSYNSRMERKLAAVLFVDLVDSTTLVTTADPEVVRRRVSSYFELASDCIARFGGTVEKFAGDAVMAVFGVPQAHEDDAVRAV